MSRTGSVLRLAKLPSEADGKNILGIVEDISDDVRKRRQLEPGNQHERSAVP